MIRANISDAGLGLGHDNVNMTYVYGLGDFFSVMFEDTSVTNLLLESSTVAASEIYSRFLQLTSTLSLEDIQTTTGSQVKLVLLNSTDHVSGTATEYRLPADYTSARYVANRPLAPTELLEDGVDYRIFQEEDGSCRIRFARPLEDYAISSRVLSDGTTKQYALWFADAHLDERLISSYFGNLIGLSPENSTERFANFVYGLYYVYVQGPTLDTLRKGLNLALGIPLARLTETVIDIRTYLQTDQFIVVTDQNQYLIPFGLQPRVAVGDVLNVGDEIASWVELKDYTNDGDWWVNLYIPSNLVPTQPPGQNTRYATPGSELDFVMRNYLKTHTFLVNINVTTFKNNQQFTELFNIIRRAKPAYTQPIYVWTVKSDEQVPLEDTFTVDLTSHYEEDIGGSYRYMRRNSSGHRLLRGKSRYIRFNAPPLAKNPVGESEYLNSSGNTMQATELSGYANTVSQFRPNTAEEVMWVNVIANRSSDTWHRRRNQIGFRRDRAVVDDAMQVIPQTPQDQTAPTLQRTRLSELFDGVPESARIVPLTVVSQAELELKCGLFGLEPPDRTHRHFILAGKVPTDAINSWAIDDGQPPGKALPDLYPALFRRDSDLKNTMDLNPQMLRQFLPDLADVSEIDLLAGFRITCDLVSLCQLSHNTELSSPSFLPVHDDLDTMDAEVVSYPMRGMAPHGSPFYLSRSNISMRVSPTPPDVPDAVDHSAEVAAFLQGLGVSEGARVVPLTVMSLTEFEMKCAQWHVAKPGPAERYFVMAGQRRQSAVNSTAIDGRETSAFTPIPLTGMQLSPVSGQVEQAYPLYPDFYRRDSDVPDYPGINRHVLHEYLPLRVEIDTRDMIMGFRLDRDVVALYLVSNGAILSTGNYWSVRYTTTLGLDRVSDGSLEAMGKLVITPYATGQNQSLGYNNYDQALNEHVVNAPLNLDEGEFFYRDMYNDSLPVTRGGMLLRHRVIH